MELGRWRFLDIRNPYPRLDPDPRRNLPTSSRVPVRRVVVQSGLSRVGTQSGDNYSAGRYPDVHPPPTVIGNGGGPSPRLGWFLVVCGTGGSGGEFVDSKLLSVLPGIGLPRGRGRPAAAAHLDLLLGKP